MQFNVLDKSKRIATDNYIFCPQEKKSEPPYPPPKQVRRANFYNFHSMSMKFGMEVTFGGIQLKGNTKCPAHV